MEEKKLSFKLTNDLKLEHVNLISYGLQLVNIDNTQIITIKKVEIIEGEVLKDQTGIINDNKTDYTVLVEHKEHLIRKNTVDIKFIDKIDGKTDVFSLICQVAIDFDPKIKYKLKLQLNYLNGGKSLVEISKYTVI